MKKISFFVAIAAAASLASCTAQAPKANMKNDVDSLSYMMGITNTQGLDMYMSQQLGVDTAYMADFIRGVKEGTSKTSPKDVAYMAGLQIGQQVGGRMFDMMSQRIFGNDSTQSLSKENFLAGFMAALQKKGMNVTMEEANAYVQSKAEAIKTKATEAQFAENKAAGEKFLAENAKKEGVKTTSSGLQYKIIKEGNGAVPTDSSKVKVNYGDNYEDEYVTFKVNNKEVKDVVISSNLNIKKPGNYIIAYKLKLSSFNYYLFRVVSVIDNLKPTINLLGEDKVILDFNQAYKEPGFTATDNYDGDITNKVIVKNNVNIKKTGTYKVSYKVSDSNGNFEKKERIVIVKEKTDSVVKETPKIEVIDGITYVNGILLVNKTYHLPSNYDPKVNKEALEALKEMQADCQAIGLNIPLVSGYRSFETQKKLYGNYVKRDGEKIANTYSAKPGESEHQTGLSFDVGKVDSSFANTKEAKWIDENAYLYGFIVRYPKNKTNITGYIYEPWHIRYLGKKTAKMVYESKLTLEEYLGVD